MTTKLLSFTTLLMCAAPLFSQNAEKTLSKSFNTEGKPKVSLDLPGAVDLKVWDQATIRIEVHITLPNSSASMLNELSNNGRYNMVSAVGTSTLLINAPNLARPVKVKGEVLKEVMSFVVYVPEGLEVEIIKPSPVLADAK